MAGDPLIASITLFGANFAPRGTALCQGQLLPISSNTALFSLLGTIYGGDGRTTFALPDLRGRVPIGNGNGPGLTPRSLGQRGGNESTILTVGNLPAHNHTGTIKTTNSDGNEDKAANSYIAKNTLGGALPFTLDTDLSKSMAAGSLAINNTGGGQSFSNIQPYLVLNYIIALVGIFPSRS